MISTIEAVRQLVHSAPPSLLGILFLMGQPRPFLAYFRSFRQELDR